MPPGRVGVPHKQHAALIVHHHAAYTQRHRSLQAPKRLEGAVAEGAFSQTLNFPKTAAVQRSLLAGSGIEERQTRLKVKQTRELLVAAVWAIVTVVAVFAVLNLLEYRRLD